MSKTNKTSNYTEEETVVVFDHIKDYKDLVINLYPLQQDGDYVELQNLLSAGNSNSASDKYSCVANSLSECTINTILKDDRVPKTKKDQLKALLEQREKQQQHTKLLLEKLKPSPRPY